MAISTKPFHPLDVENNRRYKVTKKAAPKIAWHKTEETGTHNWEGYIRIAEEGDYTFSVTLDDNGYIEINGQKVVEITGTNSSKSKTGDPVHLKKGFHYTKLQHRNEEVPEAIAPYPNAEEFVPKIGETDLELWEIDAPKNLMKAADAQKLLGHYQGLVDYKTIPSDQSDKVWEKFGKKVATDMAGEQTCATRLSIALNRYGYRLNGAKYPNGSQASNNVLNMGGDIGILNPGMTPESDPSSLGKHIIISAEVMAGHLNGTIMKNMGCDGSDYTSPEDYSTPQQGDIVIFGDSLHVGMCPGDDESVGSFLSGGVWLLYRSTLDDKE